MTMKTRYLTEQEIINVHAMVAEDASVRDRNALGSAVNKPQSGFMGEEVYMSLDEKAAALLVGVLMNHPFTDGNKRSAWLSTMVFYRINGAAFPRVEDLNVVDFIIKVITEDNDVYVVAEGLRGLRSIE